MDDFLCFDESLFEREANDERPRYPAFLPNIVGDLKFLHENDEESLKASSDWFYLLNEYDRCSECLLKLWGIDSIQASDGYPKRIITEAIVRCFLKLNKKQDLSFFLKHHCQLSITQEDYIGHLMIRLMPQAYESKRDRIELLQRLLLAVPPSFFDGDSSLVNNTNSSSTQFQLWVDLSSLWSSIEIDDAVQKQFYPVWFTQIALLYAEILNIPTVTLMGQAVERDKVIIIDQMFNDRSSYSSTSTSS
uniref:Uncharacterized protein n=1 Tax=Trichobilharzia regenti TaxID=157069 RepID=A0AA85IUD5_TRIRE|nr:unnamed protein product [Trichobilharzia regenti]